jgi:type IV pilus assembly protein PilO
MKLGPREGVLILLLIAMPVASWWFVFRPGSALNKEMVKQIEQRKDRLQKLNRATAAMGSLKEEIASLAKAIDFLQSRLPNEKEIDKVLQEIWRLAKANSMRPKSVRTLKKGEGSFAPAGGPHSEQPIDVELEGSFRGFYAFLQALENRPRIMRIRKMNILKAKGAEEGDVQVKFEMAIFFERSREEVQ